MVYKVLKSVMFCSFLSIVVILGACTENDDSGSSRGELRFLNVIADEPRVDFSLDEDLITSSVSFLEATQYYRVDAMRYDFVVNQAGTFSELLRDSNTIGKDKRYTFIACGPSDDTGSIFMLDNNVDSTDDRANLRFVNAVTSRLKVDAYVIPEKGPIPTVAAQSDIGSKGVTEYINGFPGNYRLEFRNSLNDNLVARSEWVNIKNGQVLSVILAGGEEGYSVAVIVENE
ncbi:MAG: DUF4397 domain-containing protein [SAR324 cluster bacterium]|uniref:DUF4397 domain-containing protein n=1 Tax=SAR324 cluster bacterium TaxID=2024889 RepID=A0A7X9FRH3_9DELT|nr:DUF4397 domain-containing protein [SAR324 cluster bacterium]